jgi:hypothetical protein
VGKTQDFEEFDVQMLLRLDLHCVFTVGRTDSSFVVHRFGLTVHRLIKLITMPSLISICLFSRLTTWYSTSTCLKLLLITIKIGANKHVLELHDVSCQSPRLIAEDVVDLTKVLNDADRANLGEFVSIP